jgi:2-C-methyl-D-erythritol 4-phosphate cytidylyltransferase
MKGDGVAIVPAAGSGKRLGPGTNKPFEKIFGKPLVIWTLEILEAASEIREIIPVIKESDMEYAAELFQQYRLSKVRRIAPGGKERQDSVLHGLRLVDNKEDIIIIHDGVRPFIEERMICEALGLLKDCDGVVVGVPVKDTVKEVQDGEVVGTMRRERIWAVQTPQIFRYGTIMSAYEKARQESFSSTDDSALVERYGGKIKVVNGSYANIKITTPEDLTIAESFLKLRGQKS